MNFKNLLMIAVAIVRISTDAQAMQDYLSDEMLEEIKSCVLKIENDYSEGAANELAHWANETCSDEEYEEGEAIIIARLKLEKKAELNNLISAIVRRTRYSRKVVENAVNSYRETVI